MNCRCTNCQTTRSYPAFVRKGVYAECNGCGQRSLHLPTGRTQPAAPLPPAYRR